MNPLEEKHNDPSYIINDFCLKNQRIMTYNRTNGHVNAWNSCEDVTGHVQMSDKLTDIGGQKHFDDAIAIRL